MNRFVNRSLLRGHGRVGAVLGLALVVALASGQVMRVIRDKEGVLELKNLASFRSTQVTKSQIVHRGKGAPRFNATWAERGLALSGESLEVVTDKNADGDFEVSVVHVVGGVKGSVDETDERGLKRTATLDCDTAELNAAKNTGTLQGGVSIDARSPEEGKRLKFTGSSAEIGLVPLKTKADFPFTRVEVAGPITVRYESEVQDAETKKSRKVLISAKGSRLVYNDDARTLTLTGNVTLEGNDELVGTNVQASRAVLKFDAKRDLIDVELTGDPGTSTLREKPARSRR